MKVQSFAVGSKVPTDKNKLLLQWKGPFLVETVVGQDDYGIKIGDKVKTFHANMLKQYVERQQSSKNTARENPQPGDTAVTQDVRFSK